MLVEKALLHGRPGPLQVQAAIAAVHCAAMRAEHTDWAEIERLYGALEAMPLAEELQRYRPYHAVRAALLEEQGDVEGAIEALEAALECEPTRQEADYIAERIAALKRGDHAVEPGRARTSS
jgi:RNA polymerase sigma-70 factor, ECF subfamily